MGCLKTVLFPVKCCETPHPPKLEEPLVARADVVVYYIHIGRTNIDLDEALVKRVMHRYGLTTKRAAVDLALRRLDLEPMSRDGALAMRGTGWDGDLEQLRDETILSPS